MKVGWLATCMVTIGCYAQTPPIQFGAGKSPQQAQEQRLGELMPPQLVADKTWPGKVETVKVRIWADDQYRAQNVKWQEMFR